MSLSSELTSIKNVEDTLTNNKVAQFAYTQCAYACNCADGVTEYDVTKEQNIPVGTPLVMHVNETVLAKGWRSQASSITRMLLNHFLGRISYNLNKVNDNMSDLLTQLLAYLGQANGIATLDANGRIPYSQLPESAIEFKGMWNANTNTPYLHDGTGTKGDFYIVSVAGTQDLGSGSEQFFANDRVIYDGAVWSRLSAGDVKTVNNVQPVNGNITLTKSDLGLGNVDNTADANKSVCYATSAGNATCFGGCTYACAKADFRDYTPSCATNATYACCASRDAEGCLFGTASRYSCTCFAKAGEGVSVANASLMCILTWETPSFTVDIDGVSNTFCLKKAKYSGDTSFNVAYIEVTTDSETKTYCGFEYRIESMNGGVSCCLDIGVLLYTGLKDGTYVSCGACGFTPSDWISGRSHFFACVDGGNFDFLKTGWLNTIACSTSAHISKFSLACCSCPELQHVVGIAYRNDAMDNYEPVVIVKMHAGTGAYAPVRP